MPTLHPDDYYAQQQLTRDELLEFLGNLMIMRSFKGEHQTQRQFFQEAYRLRRFPVKLMSRRRFEVINTSLSLGQSLKYYFLTILCVYSKKNSIKANIN